MLERERDTLQTVRRTPGLFAGGAVTALAWLAVHAAVAVPATLLVLPRRTRPALMLPVASVLTVFVVPAMLAGLYEAVRETREREDPPGPLVTVRLYGRGCLRSARDLTTATVAFRVAAAVPALAVLVLLLAGDTALNYWQYAAHPGEVPGALKGSTELLVVVIYGLVAGAVGRLALAFYDLPVLFGGVSPTSGWRSALRLSHRRPKALARYGLVRLLVWSPSVVVVGLEVAFLNGSGYASSSLVTFAKFAGAALVVGTVVTTLLAVYHVVTYERVFDPAFGEPTAEDATTGADSFAERPPSSDPTDNGPTGRTVAGAVLAVGLVVGLAAGTAAVRLDDARPMPDGERPVAASMNGTEILTNAERTLAHASYRASERRYRTNLTDGSRTLVMTTEVAVDRTDRRAVVSIRARDPDDGAWTESAFYGSESTLAVDFTGEWSGSRRLDSAAQFTGRVAGDWAVLYYAGYPFVSEMTGTLNLDADAARMRVLQRSDRRVVVGYSRRPDDDGGEDDLVVERFRLVVDRDTGRPIRIVRNRTFGDIENGSVVGRYRLRTVRTFSDYGETTVPRPAPTGSRGPLEWLWDLVYY